MAWGDWRSYRSLGCGPAKIWEREERESDSAQTIAEANERERHEAREQADHQAIVRALEGLNVKLDPESHKANSRDKRNRRIELLRIRQESRKFKVDLSAVVVAGVAALLLIIQSIIFLFTLYATQHATKKAHDDSVAALGRADIANLQAREFFQDAQQPILWRPTDAEAGKIDRPIWVPVAGAPGHRGNIIWRQDLKNYGVGTAFTVIAENTIKIRGTDCLFAGVAATPAIVPPQGRLYSIASCPDYFLTHREFNALVRQNFSISLTETVSYKDAFGRKYQTDICDMSNGPNAVGVCPGAGIKKIK